MEITCYVCHKKFRRKKFAVERAKNPTCSKNCEIKLRKIRADQRNKRTCVICGLIFIASGKIKRKEKPCCSVKCSGIAKRKKNPMFCCGYPVAEDRKGYLIILAGKNHKKRLHRVIAAEEWGESAILGKDVHHIDGNKHNNDISNLVILSAADHRLLHAAEKRKNNEIEIANNKGDPTKHKKCIICGEIKEKSAFGKRENTFDKLASDCKACNYKMFRKNQLRRKNNGYGSDLLNGSSDKRRRSDNDEHGQTGAQV